MSNSRHFNFSFLKLKQSEGQTFLKLLAVAVLIKLLAVAVLIKLLGGVIDCLAVIFLLYFLIKNRTSNAAVGNSLSIQFKKSFDQLEDSTWYY